MDKRRIGVTKDIDEFEGRINRGAAGLLDSFLATIDEPEKAAAIKEQYSGKITDYIVSGIDAKKMSEEKFKLQKQRDDIANDLNFDKSPTLQKQYNNLERQIDRLGKQISNIDERNTVTKDILTTGKNRNFTEDIFTRVGKDLNEEGFQLYKTFGEADSGSLVPNQQVLDSLNARASFMARLSKDKYHENQVHIDARGRPYSIFQVNNQNLRLTVNMEDQGYKAFINDGTMNIHYGSFGEGYSQTTMAGVEKIMFKDVKSLPFNHNPSHLIGNLGEFTGNNKIPYIRVNTDASRYIPFNGYDGGASGAKRMFARAYKAFSRDGNPSSVLGLDIETVAGTESIEYLHAQAKGVSLTAYTDTFIKSLDRNNYIDDLKTLGVIGKSDIEDMTKTISSFKEEASKVFNLEKQKHVGTPAEFAAKLNDKDFMGNILDTIMASHPYDPNNSIEKELFNVLKGAAKDKIRQHITLETGIRYNSEADILKDFSENILSQTKSSTSVFNQNVKFDVNSLIDRMQFHNVGTKQLEALKNNMIDLILLSQMADPEQSSYAQEKALQRLFGNNYSEHHLGKGDYLHAVEAARIYIEKILSQRKSSGRPLIEPVDFTGKGLIYDSTTKRTFKVLGGAGGLASDIVGGVDTDRMNLLIQESDYGLGINMPTRLMPISQIYEQGNTLAQGIIDSSNTGLRTEQRLEDLARGLVRNLTTKSDKDNKYSRLMSFTHLFDDIEEAKALAQSENISLIDAMRSKVGDLRNLAFTETKNSPNSDRAFQRRSAAHRASELEKFIPVDDMLAAQSLASMGKLSRFRADLGAFHISNIERLLSEVSNLDEDGRDVLVEDYFKKSFEATPITQVTEADGRLVAARDYIAGLKESDSNSITEDILARYRRGRGYSKFTAQGITQAANEKLSQSLQDKIDSKKAEKEAAYRGMQRAYAGGAAGEEVDSRVEQFLRYEKESFEDTIKSGGYSPDAVLTSPIEALEYSNRKIDILEQLAAIEKQEVTNIKGVTTGKMIAKSEKFLTGLFNSGAGRVAMAGAALAATSYLTYKALERPDLGQSERAKREKTLPLQEVDTIVEDDTVIEKRLEQKRNLYVRAIGTTSGPVDSRVLNQVVAETVAPYIHVEKAQAHVKDNRQKIEGKWLDRVDFSSFGV